MLTNRTIDFGRAWTWEERERFKETGIAPNTTLNSEGRPCVSILSEVIPGNVPDFLSGDLLDNTTLFMINPVNLLVDNDHK